MATLMAMKGCPNLGILASELCMSLAWFTAAANSQELLAGEKLLLEFGRGTRASKVLAVDERLQSEQASEDEAA